jgi:hypothetical protein
MAQKGSHSRFRGSHRKFGNIRFAEAFAFMGPNALREPFTSDTRTLDSFSEFERPINLG